MRLVQERQACCDIFADLPVVNSQGKVLIKVNSKKLVIVRIKQLEHHADHVDLKLSWQFAIRLFEYNQLPFNCIDFNSTLYA